MPAPRMARALVAALASSLAGCASLPKVRTVTPSYAVSEGTSDTMLGRVAAAAVAELQAPSGVHLMPRGPDAFLARLALVAAAERSLDAQYYIWQNDTTGRLLALAVLEAARRGVRVRLLIDDVGSSPNDENLLLIDEHPNIEVRLFNPVADRTARKLSMAGDFSRTNRRMHNKSLTADNQVTIVGGRNIGDEYFEASPELDFGDLDALAVGAVVEDVSHQFDRYWNSPVAYGITELRKSRPSAEVKARAVASLRTTEREQQGGAYARAVRDGELARELREGKVAFSPARVTLRADDPVKVEHPDEDRSKNLLPQLLPEFANTSRQLVLVSPYFIPGKKGVEALGRVEDRGVQVRVVTNSLASTDVVPVFSAYRKYRRALLEAGVELYEVDPAATRPSPGGEREHPGEDMSGGSSRARAALHGKLLVFDCREFFVGSMNLDPRSAFTNTEVGFVVESPDLAGRLCQGLDAALANGTFRLDLRQRSTGGTETQWTDRGGAGEARFSSEPRSGAWRRFTAWFYSLLPIEPLL